MSRITRFVARSISVLALAVLGLYLHQQQVTDDPPDQYSTAASVLEISATTLAFGLVEIDEASSAILTLSNTGAEPLVISSLFLDEVDTQNYSLSHQAPLSLEPSESIYLTISFEPTESGDKPGALFITHTGQGATEVVDLRGAGAQNSDDEPLIAAANPNSFPFGKSKLGNFTGSKPTSLQFGPDGRLYVATMKGDIHVMEVERDSKNKYKVVNRDIISNVRNIPNHSDTGANQPHVKNRLVTGLLVTGTFSTPVIYVQSSDPRIGGGASGHTTGLDTNSGIVSRLTKNGNGWDKLDIVRGLPRSEENHHGNGMELVGNKLYLAAGGNTNMGATSNNFALLPEYALSAAILEIDLDAIGNTTYDIPTLDDENRSGANDYNDPFGGNGGKNQAMIVENGPVQVYSPGWRNAYDIVVMQNGRMYSWDNGPNSGWGGAPSNCNNNRSEPGSTQHDSLHHIEVRGYYAGHPNPTRAHTKNKFNSSNPQAAVPYNNTIECNYYGPGTYGNGKHPSNKSMVSLPRSTTGLTEYAASNFSGNLQGSILATSWDNKVHRVYFNSAGDFGGIQTLFSSVGHGPLDVTALSDYGLYPGTIWVADFHGSDIVVYEPGDYQGNNTICTPGTGSSDADEDGFTDADEIANGTDVCSAADIPPDVDGDKVSDLTDSDDDNDGIPDNTDPFALDKFNGATTALNIDYQWENDDTGAGFIGNLGFSGLMNNGLDNYQDQFDLNQMTIIGAAGVLTIDEVPPEDALANLNSQQYGFQLGVNALPESGVFRVHSRILAPFSGVNAQSGQSMGIYIGNGDQDNYTKLVITEGGLQFMSEVDAQVVSDDSYSESVIGAEAVDLIIEVDPASAIATAIYSLTVNGISYAESTIGSVVFPASWLTAQTRLAAGIISTSGDADSFPATWDFLTVKPKSGSSNNTPPEISLAAPGTVLVNTPVLLNGVVVDDGLPNGTTESQWSTLNAPGSVSFGDSNDVDTSATFDSAGTYELLLTATDGELSASLPVTVTVVEDSGSSNGEVVYRLNAGGPEIARASGNWLNDAPFVNTGNSWSSSSTISAGSVSNVPLGLFNTERYDTPGGAAMEWSLPVTPGSYEVHIYLAEIWAGAMFSGGRVFDVQVEDELIENIDVFSSAGANTAFKTAMLVDSDDVLNIKTLHGVQNPAIKAIEVVSLSQASACDGPSNFAPADFLSLSGTTTFTWDDNGGCEYSLSMLGQGWSNEAAGTYSTQPSKTVTGYPIDGSDATAKLFYRAVGSTASQWIDIDLQTADKPQPVSLQTPAADATIASNARTFVWEALPEATEYRLWVNYPSKSKAHAQWYTAAQANCASGTGSCSIQIPPLQINAGAGGWWVQARNLAGSGGWGSENVFTVESSGQAISLIAPSGAIISDNPLYRWQPYSGATWYRLVVKDNSGSALFSNWHTSASAGCDDGNSECAVHGPVQVSGELSWTIQTWDTAMGPISYAKAFSVVESAGPPGKAGLIGASLAGDGGLLTYQWSEVGDATWYYLWVNRPGSTNVLKKWYTKDAANCDGTTCSVTPPVAINDDARWWIQTWNINGEGPWSDALDFAP